MTTTEPLNMTPETPPPSGTRLLRRSRTDRIGAGVAGGLGEYFGIDPIIFRVLFATAAFFGGAGVLAYLLAWAAIPEQGTDHAPIDRWLTALRQHRVPMWVVVGGAAVALWLIAFSWWAPGRFVPVLAVVIILSVVFGRRGRADAVERGRTPETTVNLTKQPAAEQASGQPTWVDESRRWVAESRAASRRRARRAFPVKVATLTTLAATLLVLGLIDAAGGIWLPVYFWVSLGILATGLLIGIVLRRAPWSLAALLIPTVIGLVAFAGSHASLHDGFGERHWRPQDSLASSYDLAFGQGALDLRSLNAQHSARTVRIDQAAGQVHIIAPKSMNLKVDANVRFGTITVDGDTDSSRGVGVNRFVEALPGATGAPITVDVHLADGRINIDRR